MTTSSPRPRHPWAKVSGFVALPVAAYGLWVLALELPGVMFLLVVVAVVALDGLLLVLAAKRRSRGLAIWCGVVALLAALAQAIWVFIPFAWDVLAPDGNGVVWFASSLTLALLLSVALLVRRESRPLGWAILMGSAQGFIAAFLLILAAFASAMGAD